MIANNERVILWVIIGAALTFILTKGCGKTPVNEDLIVAREQAKSIERIRIKDSLANAAYLKLKDENIALLQQKEAVIVNQYIQSNDKLKNIPAVVNALIRDSLRSAIQRYAMLRD